MPVGCQNSGPDPPKMPWNQVYFVQERGNRIEVGLESGSIQWEFDHAWLLSKLSARYRSRGGQNEEQLTAALEHSRAGRDTTTETRGQRIDRSFLICAPLPLAIPLTIWLKAASLV
ncbi:hypothetical protein [Amycolatopsis silviterrae]|uniref:DUF1508 domain-containing protein n=1 Tax=Amycolatopsis silviterrae TaxID=1656914 RepID=A0ABW5HKM8_9PSEU